MDKEKIKKLAELLGEPVWRIKEALGIGCDKDYSSSSDNELKIDFRDSAPDSEEEYFIQKELERRLEIEISSGVFNRIRDAYFLALELELEKTKLKALQAWDDLSLEEVNKASSYEEIKTACNRAPKAGRARILAHERKNAILEEQYNEAESLQDYIALFKKASFETNLKSQIAQKIFELLGD